MRTKQLLTALALPALLVACTNDDFVSDSISQLQSARPTLENFTMTLSGEEAGTRYDVSENMVIKYEQGDQLGACIIDKYEPYKEPEDWTILPSLAGNYPFTYDGSRWESASPLGIGHYLFMYPFNPEDNTRGAATYELPVIQELYDDVDGEVRLGAAIEKGNKAIGTTVLHMGEKAGNYTMYNVFTYPKFVINIDNGEKIQTVSQVVLKNSDGDGWMVKGGYNHQTIAAMAKDDKTALSSAPYWDAKNECVDWSKVQTSDLLLSSTSTNASYTKMEYSQYLIAKLPNNTKMTVDPVTNNKTITVSFMMPSMASTSSMNNYSIYVYTDNGIYKADLDQDAMVFKETTNQSTRNTVLSRAKGLTLTLNKTAFTKSDSKTVGYIVTSVEDWNSLVDTYGSSSNFTENAPLLVNIVGSGFKFNKDAKMPSVARFKIETPVSVDGDVTIKNVQVTSTVTIESGATLTASKTFSTGAVKNYGTLVIPADVTPKATDTYSGVRALYNYGNASIEKGANVYMPFLSNGKLSQVWSSTNNQWEWVTSDENGGDSSKGAQFDNAGTLTLYNGCNGTTVNNTGTMNVAYFYNLGGEYDYKNWVYINLPYIINDGTILATTGDVRNDGCLVQHGKLTCKAGTSATIQNYGSLSAYTGNYTYITTNGGYVYVDKYDISDAYLQIENQNRDVIYQGSETSINLKGSQITKLVATGNGIKITDLGSLNTLEVDGGGNIEVAGGKIKTLNVNANATISADLEANNVYIDEDVEVVVSKDKTFYAKSLNNQGTILVTGTLKSDNSGTNSVNQSAGLDNGKVETTSGATAENIIWAANTQYVPTETTYVVNVTIKRLTNEAGQNINMGSDYEEDWGSNDADAAEVTKTTNKDASGRLIANATIRSVKELWIALNTKKGVLATKTAGNGDVTKFVLGDVITIERDLNCTSEATYSTYDADGNAVYTDGVKQTYKKYDYERMVELFAGKTIVMSDGSSWNNLAKSQGISIKKLVIDKEATITGTNNAVNLAVTDAIELNAALTVTGYIGISESATEYMAPDKVTKGASGSMTPTDGGIYSSNGLKLDVNAWKWIKMSESYSDATSESATATAE